MKRHVVHKSLFRNSFIVMLVMSSVVIAMSLLVFVLRGAEHNIRLVGHNIRFVRVFLEKLIALFGRGQPVGIVDGSGSPVGLDLGARPHEVGPGGGIVAAASAVAALPVGVVVASSPLVAPGAVLAHRVTQWLSPVRAVRAIGTSITNGIAAVSGVAGQTNVNVVSVEGGSRHRSPVSPLGPVRLLFPFTEGDNRISSGSDDDEADTVRTNLSWLPPRAPWRPGVVAYEHLIPREMDCTNTALVWRIVGANVCGAWNRRGYIRRIAMEIDATNLYGIRCLHRHYRRVAAAFILQDAVREFLDLPEYVSEDDSDFDPDGVEDEFEDGSFSDSDLDCELTESSGDDVDELDSAADFVGYVGSEEIGDDEVDAEDDDVSVIVAVDHILHVCSADATGSVLHMEAGNPEEDHIRYEFRGRHMLSRLSDHNLSPKANCYWEPRFRAKFRPRLQR